MRKWSDGYGDCDVFPGDPACLCCPKIWGQDGYCQFLPVDYDELKEKARKTLKEEECEECLKGLPDGMEWTCGYTYPKNHLKWLGQTELSEYVRESETEYK